MSAMLVKSAVVFSSFFFQSHRLSLVITSEIGQVNLFTSFTYSQLLLLIKKTDFMYQDCHK